MSTVDPPTHDLRDNDPWHTDRHQKRCCGEVIIDRKDETEHKQSPAAKQRKLYRLTCALDRDGRGHRARLYACGVFAVNTFRCAKGHQYAI
jgi:hypothetical protein